MAVMRYRSDGSPETKLNGTGRNAFAFTLPGSLNEESMSVAIQPDGKILVAGGSQVQKQRRWYFALARLNPIGTLDRSLSGRGYQRFTVSSPGSDVATCIGLQGHGSVVLAGWSEIQGKTTEISMIRLKPSGRS
jgi:uncharacterized delta-60 repeat protein